MRQVVHWIDGVLLYEDCSRSPVFEVVSVGRVVCVLRVDIVHECEGLLLSDHPFISKAGLSECLFVEVILALSSWHLLQIEILTPKPRIDVC